MMTIKEAISQLESIKRDSESRIDKDDPNDIWTADVEALQIAIDVLKERDCQWISVKDRLPEKSQTVLIAVYGCDFVILNPGETREDAVRRMNKKIKYVSMGSLEDDGWYGADGFPQLKNPLYWKPLPELPEEI